MEVCGTHTAAIRSSGIPSILSDDIQLVTGPGCPVCVTVSSYIDKLMELSCDSRNVIVTFGDLMRVPGSGGSLMEAGAKGADVRYVYSPLDMLRMAAPDREHIFIFAAVGFETTAPVYASMIKTAAEEGIDNIRLLTSLKIMPPAIRRVSEGIDGFIAPGHVAVITGTSEYEELASSLGIPFVISGFSGEGLLSSIYALVKMAERGTAECLNLYPRAVKPSGNTRARQEVGEYFEPCDVAWRGMGIIPGSGLILKEAYSRYDAGSARINEDVTIPGCRCPEVITGKASPEGCPLFGTGCTPDHPVGACMVSQEGACFNAQKG